MKETIEKLNTLGYLAFMLQDQPAVVVALATSQTARIMSFQQARDLAEGVTLQVEVIDG